MRGEVSRGEGRGERGEGAEAEDSEESWVGYHWYSSFVAVSHLISMCGHPP